MADLGHSTQRDRIWRSQDSTSISRNDYLNIGCRDNISISRNHRVEITIILISRNSVS